MWERQGCELQRHLLTLKDCIDWPTLDGSSRLEFDQIVEIFSHWSVTLIHLAWTDRAWAWGRCPAPDWSGKLIISREDQSSTGTGPETQSSWCTIAWLLTLFWKVIHDVFLTISLCYNSPWAALSSSWDSSWTGECSSLWARHDQCGPSGQWPVSRGPGTVTSQRGSSQTASSVQLSFH